jgi:ABC-type Mn2+/Zn2+ transport system ATPase subunit
VSVALRLDQVGVPGRLAPVSFEVPTGGVHLLLGPNGAGKSTVLDCVLGRVDSTGHLTRPPGLLAWVPQRLEVSAVLPVTVTEFLRASRTRRPLLWGGPAALDAEVAQVLAHVGLPHLGGRALSALSVGELKRVLLADALASPAPLVLLDEPEAGLDAGALEWLEALLRALTAAGRTALVVTHDLARLGPLARGTTLLPGGHRG